MFPKLQNVHKVTKIRENFNNQQREREREREREGDENAKSSKFNGVRETRVNGKNRNSRFKSFCWRYREKLDINNF